MEYIIKKVEIGYLKNPNKTGIIQNSMTVYTLEKEVIDEKVCFIMDGYAVEVEDFSVAYPIVKRNKFNQITPYQKIDENVLYALDIKKLEKEDLTTLKKIRYEKRAKQYKKLNQ